MHWNHRVVRTVRPEGTRMPAVLYAIHETYYGIDGRPGTIAITNDPTTVLGESLEELRESLGLMLKALDHPVLDGDADPIVELPAEAS